ncbi:MAG: amino acid adenylation domain-containing protein [Acidobacteria bacterium]|nr:amino acid adenylation domain-containing protein [Acidobacteriota bacterium]
MASKTNHKFSCLIVGGGTLPIRCSEILLLSGHEICAVVSGDARFREWANEKKIVSLIPENDLAGQIEKPFDYLFSIVNEHILQEDILRLPRKLAINYHDAPLPRYAGTHATSWALMNGEKTHGISWHVITDLVDGGDILRQKQIDVARDETALTLNTKCYEAATEAFANLVEDIATGKLVRKKQDLEKRTFFPKFKQASNGGVISWSSSSEEISALIRALDFGPHPNPLGVAKIAIGDNFFIVTGADNSDLNSESSPGTISEIGPDFLRVSTSDKDIILRNLSRLDGESIPISDFVAEFDLCIGYKLHNLEPETTKRVEVGINTVCKHEYYWVEKLSTLEPAAPPFADKLSVFSESESASFSVPAEFLNFCERSNRTLKLSDYLVAAFGAFLSRLIGIDSFDVGYGRFDTTGEFAGLEKLFASQVPFRIHVDGRRCFMESLQSTEKEIELVRGHGPFIRDIVSRYPELRLLREAEKKFTLPVGVVIMSNFHYLDGLTEGKLTLLISDNESGFRWIYDKNSFDTESIGKLARHFTTFLNGIAGDSDCPIASLPLLSEDERHQVLAEWNSDRIYVSPDKCIHHFFEAQVDRTPEAVALIVDSGRLTYRELNRRANQLAWHLRTLGVGPEILVAICVERSVEMIVGLLAILKAGGAYVPLDPSYPQDRLSHMLSDSQASVLLTKTTAAGWLGRHNATAVYLDEDRRTDEKAGETNPVSGVEQRNLAYVIYTSGSTGKPKGVAIEHRSTAAFLTWATSVFNTEKLRGTLASTSVCFDLSVFEMFAPLACGGTIILVENILHLPGTPAAKEVTLINTVPSAIAELERINGIPDSVRTVNLAGEPLKASLVRQIYETGTVREVFDLYGPTEDTTYSTFTLRDTGKATIGRPISNTQAYVLDRNLQPLPVGIPGELYLGGDGLARGYLNMPELTAERFIKNPFGLSSDARLYKTGDLVRYQSSGEIEYLGRIDNQVKIRGYRIELGEIETALSRHSAVKEAVVIAREDQGDEKRLVAYFVPVEGRALSIVELSEHLKASLPDFMIPSAFVELTELPLTPNGKLDRRALPAPATTSLVLQSDFVAHRDDLESKLVKIWEKTLGIQPIGVKDNFFELGGHSLKAIRMFAEVEETFGKNIPLATLFESGTIEKLAAILRQDGWTAPESSLVPIQPKGTKLPFFCIHAKGGNVLFYRDLAKYLGDDQPFYGLQARRLAGRQIGHATVEEMAEFYIKEIKALQPDGPYCVGGSSFGGLVAFEIAQQLYRQGEKIALLALLDTGTPDYPKILPNTTAFRLKVYQLIRRAQHHKDSLKAFSAKEKADYVLEKLRKVKLKYWRKVRDIYKKAVRNFYGVTRGVNSIPTSYIQIEDLIRKAGQKYSPEVYPGNMTLFRASIQPMGIQPDPTLGWENLVEGKIETHEVPGHHGSIVAKPYVHVLAKNLRDCLEAVQLEETQSLVQSPVRSGAREFVQAAGIGVTA